MNRIELFFGFWTNLDFLKAFSLFHHTCTHTFQTTHTHTHTHTYTHTHTHIHTHTRTDTHTHTHSHTHTYFNHKKNTNRPQLQHELQPKIPLQKIRKRTNKHNTRNPRLPSIHKRNP